MKAACAVLGRRIALWFYFWRLSKDHTGVIACFSPFTPNSVHFTLVFVIFQSMQYIFSTLKTITCSRYNTTLTKKALLRLILNRNMLRMVIA